MAQPSNQVLVDTAHPWAGPFWYAHNTGGAGANDNGLWNALDGIMEAKTGTGVVTVEGGANVINTTGTTYFTLASQISVVNGKTLFFKVRTTANNTSSTIAGDRAATNNMVWVNNGSARTALRRTSTGNIETPNAATNTMATYHIVFNSDGTMRFYKNAGNGVVMLATSSNPLVIKHILSGYSGGSFSLNGALECIGVIPVALTTTEVATHAGDLYQTLTAPVVDDTAPILSNITASATSTTTATGTVDTSEGNGTLHYLASTDNTLIDIDDAPFWAASSLTQSVIVSGTQTVNWSGLIPSTAYTVYFGHIDAAGNPSAVIKVESAFTTAGTPSSTITLTSPLPYQSRQRNTATNLTIVAFTISGTYVGNPSSIEYRFAGGTWSTLIASPASGSFSTTLHLPTGQGNFEVRFSNDTAITYSVPFVTVGDGFASAGQSNACGRASGIVSPVPSTFTATKLGRDGVWKALSEANTVAGSFDEATSAAGSYYGALSNLLQSQPVPVFFIPCALGGVAINEWARYDPDPSNPYLLYGDVFQAYLASGGLRGIIYYQGETDAANGSSQASYSTALNNLVNDWWSDLGVKTFIVKICRWNPSIYTNIDNIRSAEQDVIDNNVNAAGGADANVWTSGNVHYNTVAEVNAVASAIYSGVFDAFYSLTTALSSTTAVIYKVRGNLEKDFAFNYVLKGQLSSGVVYSYNIKSSLSNILSLDYNVLSSQQVFSNLNIDFKVRLNTQTNSNLLWYIRSIVNSSSGIAYLIRAVTAGQTSVEYKIYTSASSNNLLEYKLRNTLQAQKGISSKVRGSTSQQASFNYNILSQLIVRKDYQILYSILSELGSDFTDIFITQQEIVDVTVIDNSIINIYIV